MESEINEQVVQENESVKNDEVEKKTENNDEEDEWMDILGSGQLKKKIVKRADDSFRPERSHVCLVNIEGSLADGTVVEKYEGFHFQIGDGEVIQGLDLALPLMYIGETALLEVSPRFGYGSLGSAPSIPPNQTLFYRIELVSAEPEADIESYSVSDRKSIGNRKRERGNWWYSRQEPILAIQCYRRALDYLDDVEGGIIIKPDYDVEKPADQELHDLFEDRLKVYNNLAAAQMKIKAYDTALQSVENVLRCQPNNVKALFRKGKILAAKGDFANSVTILRRASELEPESKLLRQELNKMLNLQKADTKQETSLYKKMLGQGKETERKANSSPTRTQNRFYPWAMVVAGTAVVVAGMLAFRYKYL